MDLTTRLLIDHHGTHSAALPVVILPLSLQLALLVSFISAPSVFFLIMTIKGGTSQACAACKYQRRRCSKDCALAPYFPADQPKMFQNAHRLFGVCNIMKILRQVHPSQKDETMTSIIYESNMRARFPVHGCCGIIWQLHYQIQQALDELRQVKTRIGMVKEQFQNQVNTNNNNNNNNSINSIVPCPPPTLDGIVGSNDVVYPVYTHQYNSGLMVNQTDPNDFFGNGNNGGIYVDENDDNNGLMLKELRIQQHYNDNYGINISNVDSMLMQSNLIPTVQGYPLQQEMEISHDYDEMPFDTIADDRQSYIESKEACDSSAESTFKDVSESTAEYVSRNELKNAAACFSLTSHVK